MEKGKNKIKIKKIAKTHIAAIIAIAVIVAGAGTVYGTLSSQVVDYGTDPVSGENSAKTQVLIQGQGYSLEDAQKNQYDLPQKLEKKTDGNTLKRYTPRRPNSTVRPHRYKHTSGRGGKSGSNAPTIKTNLKNQTVTAGKEVSFWVEGKTYSKLSIRSKYFDVKMGSKELKGTGSDTHYTYSVAVPEGKNTIKITVTDNLRKKSTSKSYVVTGKKKEEVKETYVVTATISTPGLLIDGGEISETVTCECTEGDSASAVWKAVNQEFEKLGFSLSPSDGTPTKLTLSDEVDIIPADADQESDPDDPEAGGTEPIHGKTIENKTTFGGKWTSSNVPSELAGELLIDITFELP